jgi:hypothetical protein
MRNSLGAERQQWALTCRELEKERDEIKRNARQLREQIKELSKTNEEQKAALRRIENKPRSDASSQIDDLPPRGYPPPIGFPPRGPPPGGPFGGPPGGPKNHHMNINI